MTNDYDETDLPIAGLCDQSKNDIASALGASKIVSIAGMPFSVDDSHDPLPSNMIMAAYQLLSEADLLTEEDELTEDLDRTLEDYFESSQFQADLFKMRWAV